MQTDAQLLSEQFLKQVAELQASVGTGKWAFHYFRTTRGPQVRTEFLDACAELFLMFVGKPREAIYGAIIEALRVGSGRRGEVQRFAGMVLLNLAIHAPGEVDELLEIVAPVYNGNFEIPAFLVREIGIQALFAKIQALKKAAVSREVITRLDRLAYEAQMYESTQGPYQ